MKKAANSVIIKNRLSGDNRKPLKRYEKDEASWHFLRIGRISSGPDFADKKSAEPGAEQYWTQYFLREKDFYEKLLKGEAPKSGTVQALADHFGVDIIEMTGYLDGINESLKAENDLENMTAETEVSLDYEPEKLYYNMVGAKAEWLYKLPQWDSILTEEKRKELYKAQKASTTIVKGPKVGRNDPCPCGSGKKYKKCCGR